MRTIPKLDSSLFTEGNYVQSLREEFGNYSDAFVTSFISNHAIGYTLNQKGDCAIMFEFDGELFWGAFFRSILPFFKLELG